MLKEKIKEFINKQVEGNNKKKIENLIVFLIILIITVIAINMIWKQDKTENNNEKIMGTKELAILNNVENNNEEIQGDELEKKLENILSNMNGVRERKSTYYIF